METYMHVKESYNKYIPIWFVSRSECSQDLQLSLSDTISVILNSQNQDCLLYYMHLAVVGVHGFIKYSQNIKI